MDFYCILLYENLIFFNRFKHTFFFVYTFRFLVCGNEISFYNGGKCIEIVFMFKIG